MKYPKPWDAGRPAGKPFIGSYREGARAGQIQLATYVNRPGTPDHTRLIRTWLTVAEAEQLRDELSHHIDMMRRREASGNEQAWPPLPEGTPRCLRGDAWCARPAGHSGNCIGRIEQMTNDGSIGTGPDLNK